MEIILTKIQMNKHRQTRKFATIGELLLRMTVTNGDRFTQANEIKVHVGGAEANVCVLLSQLGIQTDYITRLPKNDLAQLALNELREYRSKHFEMYLWRRTFGIVFCRSRKSNQAIAGYLRPK